MRERERERQQEKKEEEEKEIIWGKSIPSTGNRKCKGPEAELFLGWLGNHYD